MIARGARKSRKRFGGGVLEPCCNIEITTSDRTKKLGGDAELLTLSEARLITAFEGLRSNWRRLQAGLAAVKIVGDLRDLGGPDVYSLLGHSLKTLETAEHPDRNLAHFQFRLLASQGVLPIEGPWHSIAKVSVREFSHRTWDDLDWPSLIELGSSLVKQFAAGVQAE